MHLARVGPEQLVVQQRQPVEQHVLVKLGEQLLEVVVSAGVLVEDFFGDDQHQHVRLRLRPHRVLAARQERVRADAAAAVQRVAVNVDVVAAHQDVDVAAENDLDVCSVVALAEQLAAVVVVDVVEVVRNVFDEAVVDQFVFEHVDDLESAEHDLFEPVFVPTDDGRALLFDAVVHVVEHERKLRHKHVELCLVDFGARDVVETLD